MPEKQLPLQPVLVMMGVSGPGKSTVAGVLAGRLGWDLEEGDDLHPAANVAKMTSGQPLTDDDRWPWLNAVASWIREHTLAGKPGIITCSALKHVYRNKLRGHHVVFIYLAGTKEELGRRLVGRHDHFVPTSLLNSQLAALEPPDSDEQAITLNIGRNAARQATDIIEQLHLSRQQETQ